MFLVLFALGGRGEEGEQALDFVDGGRVGVVGAVAERESGGWGEVVGAVGVVGLRVDGLRGHYCGERAFCEYYFIALDHSL